MAALLITNTTPISLTHTIDGAGALHGHHGSNDLVNYDDSLIAEKDGLPTNPVRLELHDFSDASGSWTLTASHSNSGQTVTWTRDSGASYCHHEFTETGGELGVDTVATNSGQTKTKRIFVQVKPPVAKPDDN
jgi:hypothetical protein